MNLTIQDLLPTYFEESRKGASQIWGKTISFQKGSLIQIVAPSGSGKTSLIHFLYGLRHQYTGKVLYDEKPVAAFGADDFAAYRKDNISLVLQDMRLFPEQTAFQNIDIKRQLNAYHPVAKIKEMAERLGIGDKLSSLCKTCSYGEQQRVAIIRSLMQPFDYLLLDEPFSHLDNANSEKAMRLILEEAETRKAGVIFADLERIHFYPADTVYHL
jgi:ABC-type lipoprotein export system ATPase subunit